MFAPDRQTVLGTQTSKDCLELRHQKTVKLDRQLVLGNIDKLELQKIIGNWIIKKDYCGMNLIVKPVLGKNFKTGT